MEGLRQKLGAALTSCGLRLGKVDNSDYVSCVPQETLPRITKKKKTAPPPPVESRAKKWARDIVGLGGFFVLLLTARASLADHYVVPTGSMIPTVQEGDRVFVSKAAYGLRLPLSTSWLGRWSEPARGDVVVLQSPSEEDVVLLKRIVALPGDVVEVRSGRITLNGTPLETTEREEVLGEKRHPLRIDRGGGPDFGPETVPADKVLVMGDNRGNSKDGRMFGFVNKSAVYGRAIAVYSRSGSLVWDKL